MFRCKLLVICITEKAQPDAYGYSELCRLFSGTRFADPVRDGIPNDFDRSR